ncbi:MAG: ABC transporter ATP-binding protein [Deltaproteobacteria bacterium]|nr:MAG: ABC transporter ATP-binding protein [Deltaproteobacteria bacterium]
MIEASGLTKRYDSILAVDNLSFQIYPGEVVGLLGPNGAGKTTTMRMLTGFLTPSAGEVKISGFDLLENPQEAKKKIGYLPENPPLYPELTVQETLEFSLGLREEVQKEKIEKALERTALQDVRHRLVGNISKGFRQRVGIAQAIVHEPPFLILDEPTTGLDPKQIVEIRELIQNLKGSVAILHSSHILQEISQVCDRVMIIHKGKLVANGKIADLTSALHKKRFLVTTMLDSQNLKENLLKMPGIESVEEYLSDLEDVFFSVTQNVEGNIS